MTVTRAKVQLLWHHLSFNLERDGHRQIYLSMALTHGLLPLQISTQNSHQKQTCKESGSGARLRSERTTTPGHGDYDFDDDNYDYDYNDDIWYFDIRCRCR